MAVLFRRQGRDRGRLHVGYRLRDWSDVWYEPIGPDGDENELGLFKHHTGACLLTDPMEGEVAWHPIYDLKHCETVSKAEKKRLQKQFLSNAYIYCAERDPDKIMAMEEGLGDPNFKRWDTWFKAAQTWKKKDIRARRGRRTTRAVAADVAGIDAREVEINSDSSEDEIEDPGYESAHRSATKGDSARKRKRAARDNEDERKNQNRSPVVGKTGSGDGNAPRSVGVDGVNVENGHAGHLCRPQVSDLNGGLDDDAALQRAMRASTQPESRPRGTSPAFQSQTSAGMPPARCDEPRVGQAKEGNQVNDCSEKHTVESIETE